MLPFLIAIVSGGVLYGLGIRHGYSLLSFSLSIFVLSTIFIEFVRGTRARHAMRKESYIVALGKLIWQNKRRYGGYFVHIGVVLIFLGITGSSAFKVEKEAHLLKGESIDLRNYTITYESMVQYPTANKLVTAATLSVWLDGKKYGSLNPAIETHEHADVQTTSEVAIRTTLKEDIYAILAGYEDESLGATFKLIISPLMAWIWIGSIVLSIGTIVVMLPDRREKERLRIKYAREVFDYEI